MQSRGRTPSAGGKGFSFDDSRTRFQIELEFVQCLANPNYLNFLAQQGCFEKPAFINYLRYLRYWKEPTYSRYLIYPYCLHMLDLLQLPEFRMELARGHVCRDIDDQMLLHWQHYMRKRATMIAEHVEELTGAPPRPGPTDSMGTNALMGP
ncbi:Mediator of RNA polymerase II transcription subunit 31-A [Fasciola hepatica]|uniref:Mediator of RNA polymerase II transcription subunit 31 n=1 Tax=Fasciola hepatica TaxID=6192 RepID=A0A4E0R100_FASHE|nr:Mediator of RNA polymerase II transcription subunit 31-A [Fasciola hepatica]